jgi:hypothetical protein
MVPGDRATQAYLLVATDEGFRMQVICRRVCCDPLRSLIVGLVIVLGVAGCGGHVSSRYFDPFGNVRTAGGVGE